MKYKTTYPTCYDEGARNVSVRISEVAYQLLGENEIDNTSAFVNDLIIDALQEKDFFKKRALRAINSQLQEMKKYGKHYNLVEDTSPMVAK